MTQPELPALPDVPSLRVLEPPPGGLARVRDSIDRQEQREQRRPWWLVVAPLVAAAAVALILLTGRPPRGELRTAQASAPVAAPVADLNVGTGFYWVASQPVARAPRSTMVPAVDSSGSAPVPLTP